MPKQLPQIRSVVVQPHEKHDEVHQQWFLQLAANMFCMNMVVINMFPQVLQLRYILESVTTPMQASVGLEKQVNGAWPMPQKMHFNWDEKH